MDSDKTRPIKAKVRLFRLMQNILSDKSVSPRSSFIAAFVREILRVPPTTLQYVRHCMPRALVSLLARTLPGEFDVMELMMLHDLTTASGRRSAARVVVQHTRHATTVTDSLP